MCALRLAVPLTTLCWALAAALGCDQEGAASTPASSVGGSGSSAVGGASPMGGGTGGSLDASGGAGGSSVAGVVDSGGGGSTSTPAGDPYVFTGSTDGMLRAFSMDPSDGSVTPAGSIQTPDGLDFMALGPDGNSIFVSRDSAVAVYRYDPASRSFESGSGAGTAGRGTFVAVSPAGQSVLLAHYAEGALSLLPYSASSGFGALTTLSPGANAHQVRIAANGRHVYVPCLGSDHIAIYSLDPPGTLTAAQPPSAEALGGPRHMEFHPLAPIVYVLTEVSSQLHVYDLDDPTGALSLRAGDSVYTSEDGEYHWSSDVHVTPDARFLYATNRDPPEIVIFSIAADGSLERRGSEPLDGVVRAFEIDPTGRYLQAGDEDGQLLAFRIDTTSGALSRSASTLDLGNVHATLVRYLD